MLSNAYFLAKFRFDTAENEPAKNLQNFANFPNFANPNAHVARRRGPLAREPRGPRDRALDRRGLPRRARRARRLSLSARLLPWREVVTGDTAAFKSIQNWIDIFWKQFRNYFEASPCKKM